MLAEHNFWHHRVCLANTRRMIYFFLGKVKFHVDLRSRSGHGCPGQYLNLEWSCCISFDLAAHSEHICAFPDALAQFGQELLTKKKTRIRSNDHCDVIHDVVIES